MKYLIFLFCMVVVMLARPVCRAAFRVNPKPAVRLTGTYFFTALLGFLALISGVIALVWKGRGRALIAIALSLVVFTAGALAVKALFKISL